MAIEFNCPHCQQFLRTADDKSGQVAKCPGCGEQIDVPPAAGAVREPGGLPTPTVCPACAEAVGSGDLECPFCGEPLGGGGRSDRPQLTIGDVKPGQVTAIGIMVLVGGILAVLNFLFVGLFSTGVCCLWPGLYYGLVMGIMAIIRGSKLIGQNAHLEPPPKTIAIMQIVNIINLDVPNCVMGIVTLVFLNDPRVRSFYRG